MDIKQRLQPQEVWRQVVSQPNYGDHMQLLAADALERIEKLEREAVEAYAHVRCALEAANTAAAILGSTHL